VFLFQPAEEGPPIDEDGGAAAMLATGALDDPRPTMVFGMHVAPLPSGHVAYREGTQFAASSLLRVTIAGVPAHASSPWLGADPMPAAAAIVGASAQLHRQVPAWDPVSVTFGHVEDHGRFNVIGESVTLWGTLRATTSAQLLGLQERLNRTASGIADGHGCTAVVEHLQAVPPVRNTQPWLDAVLPTIRRVVGADRVVPAPPVMAYDDVSVFVDAFGGAYLQYGVQDPARPVPNHHPAFYAEDDALLDAVRIHAHVAVEHLLAR
jgi:amidohydrolase